MTTTVRTALITNFRDSSLMYGDISAAEMLLIDRTAGPSIEVNTFSTASAEAIAEIAWTVGNRMARDWNGNAWPSNVRSMSVGDMVIINEEVVLVAASAGFTRINIRPQFMDCLSTARSEQGPMGPWADASDAVVEGMTEADAIATIEAARSI